MKTYRVGIIGLGRMGSTIDDEGHAVKPYSVAACCEVIDRLELVAGSDLQADKRGGFYRAMGCGGCLRRLSGDGGTRISRSGGGMYNGFWFV